MVRSAASTLATVLMLGAVSTAKGEDVSALGNSEFNSFNSALPGLPENWSDLPFQLRVNESTLYNSNILNTPKFTGSASQNPLQALVAGQPLSGLESVSDYTLSTKANWGSQQFFAHGSYGFYRYIDHTYLNEAHNSVDAGVDWVYTSKCSGTLIASEITAPTTPGQQPSPLTTTTLVTPSQQVGFNVINTTTALAFNETGKCAISSEWAAILNSGATSSTNTALVDKSNDFQNEFVAAGMSYSASETNSLQLLATVTGTDYTNRSVIFNSLGMPVSNTGLGLFNRFTEDQVNLSYTKNINPNLSIIASVGVVGTRNAVFYIGLPSGLEPQYSLSGSWTITPKVALSASVARVVTPPTAIISNLQTTESASFTLSYHLTPKVTLSANATADRFQSAFTPTTTNVNTLFVVNQNSSSVNVGATVNYSITPFLGANLSYQFTRTTQANLVTPTSVVMLNLNFAPY